ncbi:uncharacterized protein MEPE_05846 [Melanopsichium pennsylvanicum]|uniref:Uncharacterized protein n=1 Tax=Melanopsichium pennsylvanicum TaxID=63383 RepID=A0AAJ5C7P5_9BASI|nr:uncharacterized protein MEPE_05846 [Melanopsichium pennsylvanicum]
METKLKIKTQRQRQNDGIEIQNRKGFHGCVQYLAAFLQLRLARLVRDTDSVVESEHDANSTWTVTLGMRTRRFLDAITILCSAAVYHHVRLTQKRNARTRSWFSVPEFRKDEINVLGVACIVLSYSSACGWGQGNLTETYNKGPSMHASPSIFQLVKRKNKPSSAAWLGLDLARCSEVRMHIDKKRQRKEGLYSVRESEETEWEKKMKDAVQIGEAIRFRRAHLASHTMARRENFRSSVEKLSSSQAFELPRCSCAYINSLYVRNTLERVR